MREILVIGHVRPEGVAVLEGRDDVRVTVIEEGDRASVLAAVATADAILVRTAAIDAEVIAAAPGLKVVSRHGVGYDNVDVAALNARRIPLALAVNANRVSVAEHAMTFMLTLAKDVAGHDAAVRAGDWASRNRLGSTEIMGKRLLIIGFGRIGRDVAVRAHAFGMAIDVYDPFIDQTIIIEAGCSAIGDLDAALPSADVISVHAPLNETSRGMIDARRLALLRPSAILINTARGGIVDEAALKAALVEGRLRGAGFDVFTDEPPRPDNPLLSAPNILLSPHNAGVTGESTVRMATEAAANILDVLDGRLDPNAIVNLEAITG